LKLYKKKIRPSPRIFHVHDFAHLSTILPNEFGQNVQGFAEN